MNKRAILVTTLGLATVGTLALTPLIANAQTTQKRYGDNGKNYGNGLEIKAQAMEMSTEQLKEQLQTKTMSQVISDKGMTTEQFQEQIREATKERWQEMGLSDEEIQERTEQQQERQANCDGSGLNQNQYGNRNRSNGQ